MAVRYEFLLRALIANQDDGTMTVVNLRKAEVVKTVEAGTGVESLSFY
jgi:hypothetical protein